MSCRTLIYTVSRQAEESQTRIRYGWRSLETFLSSKVYRTGRGAAPKAGTWLTLWLHSFKPINKTKLAMSYHEGSNWQARREDEGRTLYDNIPIAIQKKMEERAAAWNEATSPYILRGIVIGYNMALQHSASSGVESAGGWVNCDDRLPAVESYYDDPPKYILKCKNDGSRGDRDVYYQDAASIREIYKNYDYAEWLDESAAAPSKDFSQILKDYKQTKDYAIRLGNADKDWTLENLPIGKQETLHALQGYKQMIKDLDAILYCYEEGFEQNLAQAIEILKALVGLKELKDSRGKTEYYSLAQPVAWERAKQYLESLNKKP